jgi:CSLREA domain-containing protein
MGFPGWRVMWAAFLVSVSAVPVMAQTFVVNSQADGVDAAANGVCETANGNGICTLRAAVMEANAVSGATILVPNGYDVVLTVPENGSAAGGDLDLSATMTISSPLGARPTIRMGSIGSRIFEIGPDIVVTLRRLQIRTATANNQLGGCISAAGTLVLEDSSLSDCHSLAINETGGGALYSTGTVNVVRSTITDSHAQGPGGCVLGTGSLSIVDSTLSGCGATLGGGIYSATNGRLTRSTVTGSSATRGGGIYATGTYRIVSSTISGNSASGSGGGISNAATMSLHNATVTRNRADSDSDGAGDGGGVENTGSFSFVNSLLANNFETASFMSGYLVVIGECLGTISSQGNNVVYLYSGSHCTINGTPPAEGDPKLADLADNGGYTATHIPLAGSPAINQGAIGGCTDVIGNPLTVDQRGVKVPIGTRCDIGAVEVEPIGDANGDGFVSVPDVFHLINYLFAGGPPPLGRANVNGQPGIDVLDVFYLINFLFAAGPAPV